MEDFKKFDLNEKTETTASDSTEICPNCKEPLGTICACFRNICIDCGKPVGNITFTVCDACWNTHVPRI